MTTRNFAALFEPRSIALFGASDRAGSVGEVVARNLATGGFQGELMFVNPRGPTVQGLQTHRRVEDLPRCPDLAVVAIPAPAVPDLIRQLGDRGCGAAIVISAGFEGADAGSQQLRQALLDAARPHLLRIVGPNCLGFMSPGRGVNASFARRAPPPGSVALVAQSGAVAAAALDWAPSHGVGFSHVVSVGDSLDVDVGDLLDYLGRDPATQAILLYVEAIRDARKFMSAARFAARTKPVVVIKGGRSAAGAKAAFSHTGALSGAAAVYDAAFRRAGLIQVEDLEGFLDAAQTFAHGFAETVGERLTILTNGGGAGVLAVDALERSGGALAELTGETIAKLDEVAPPNWSRRNPVDILGDAHPDLYGRALERLLAAPEVGAVAVLNCPTAVADSAAAAEATTRAATRAKPVFCAWLGGEGVDQAKRQLRSGGLASYESPEAAVRAFVALQAANQTRARLAEAPDDSTVVRDRAAASAIVRTALDAGRVTLEPTEVAALLDAYGIPFAPLRLTASPAAAGDAAEAIGGPVALKIVSPDLSHKSDVGGVRLQLQGRQAVTEAAEEMLRAVAAARPQARLQGFLVQAMVVRPKGQEIIAGVVRDPTFGPLVMVGHGGVAVEVLADRSLGFPPLNEPLAREMVGQTRVSRLLAGYRDRPPADLSALAQVLIALGCMATDLPEVTELDLNPLLCDAAGVVAVDARVAIKSAVPSGPRPAILPYPGYLTRSVEVAGERMTLRAIRPADAPGLIDLVERCSPQDVQFRLLGGFHHLTPALAARLSQLDYDRHMALVIEGPSSRLVAVGRLAEDPEGESGEFALLVASDQQGRGLGRLLLQAMLDYARARGLKRVWGEVSDDSAKMLTMAKAFGFEALSLAGQGRTTITKDLKG